VRFISRFACDLNVAVLKLSLIKLSRGKRNLQDNAVQIFSASVGELSNPDAVVEREMTVII
jgi:hypothetical protein